MSRHVSATEANQRFSELLREVSAGGSVTITSRGRPVAEMSPPRPRERPSADQLDALLARMRTLPGAVIGAWSRDELYER